MIAAKSNEWRIPARVWAVLVSWGLAVLLLASLFGWASWRNQQAIQRNQEEIARNQAEQDRDMCEMVAVILSGPRPVPGPAGDRARSAQQGMRDWYDKRACTSPIKTTS